MGDRGAVGLDAGISWWIHAESTGVCVCVCRQKEKETGGLYCAVITVQ